MSPFQIKVCEGFREDFQDAIGLVPRREEYLARMEREKLDLERERMKAATGTSPTTPRAERYLDYCFLYDLQGDPSSCSLGFVFASK